MKNNIFKKVCASLSAVAIALTFALSPAFESTENLSENVISASAETSSVCTTLGLKGKYLSGQKSALKRINQIRYEACKQGVKNPSTGKKLTLKDYVPIKWSSDLEYIARTRAAEASITINHTRLNGKDIWSVTSPNGIRSYGEVLAWNWTESMIMGINQWYEEKSDYVHNTGRVTGHYTAMIDPENKYVAVASFCSKNTPFYNTTAGEFCGDTTFDYDTFEEKKLNLNQTMGKGTGTVYKHISVSNSYILKNYAISGVSSLKKGKKYNLAVTTSVNAGNKVNGLKTYGKIKWSSSSPKVISVDQNGKITARKTGSATIRAVLSNGKVCKKKIKVTK